MDYNLSISVSNSCSLNCKYCYAGIGEVEESRVPVEFVIKAIDKILEVLARKSGVKIHVHFSHHGEFFNNFLDYKKIYEHLEMKWAHRIKEYTAYTNGIASEEQLRWAINSKIRFIVSFDGLPDIHDKYRPLPNGGGSSQIVLNTIDFFMKHGRFYGITVVCSREIIENIGKVFNFLMSRGINKASFVSLSRIGKAKKLMSIKEAVEIGKKAEIIKYVSLLFGLGDAGKFSQLENIPIWSNFEDICPVSKNISIFYDGKIRGCSRIVPGYRDFEELIYGSVYPSFEFDWDKMKSASKVIEGKISDICGKCPIFMKCDQSCYVGIMDAGIDHNCLFGRDILKTKIDLSKRKIAEINGDKIKFFDEIEIPIKDIAEGGIISSARLCNIMNVQEVIKKMENSQGIFGIIGSPSRMFINYVTNEGFKHVISMGNWSFFRFKTVGFFVIHGLSDKYCENCIYNIRGICDGVFEPEEFSTRAINMVKSMC